MKQNLDQISNESELIEACKNGEEWAQKAIYTEYYSVMMPVCMRYAKDDSAALDILHDGFIKIFRNISKYRTGTSLYAWIKRVMVNCAIDTYRKEVRRRSEQIETVLSVSDDTYDVVDSLSAEEIMESVQKLSPSYRTIFNLYIVEGYAHKDIADMLNIAPSTSRANLTKARLKLAKMLNAKKTQYERRSI